MSNYDIEKIVKYLTPLKSEIHKLFKWDPKLESLERLLGEIPSLKDKEQSEVYIGFKKMLNEKLHESSDNESKFKALCHWIIKDWGGIKIGDEEKLDKLIHNFLNSEKHVFERIASTSKVASFMYPEKYIIYDSRVSYSMNWILLHTNASDKFFPIPEGRNTKMIAFDINVIIRLKYKEKYNIINSENISELDKMIFIDKNKAYDELNNLIKKVNEKLWDDEEQKKAYYLTEMLLFSIADKSVYNEIINNVSIEITNK